MFIVRDASTFMLQGGAFYEAFDRAFDRAFEGPSTGPSIRRPRVFKEKVGGFEEKVGELLQTQQRTKA
ncbi:hypothetical protein Tco_0134054 [Tanacetum coccineum]